MDALANGGWLSLTGIDARCDDAWRRVLRTEVYTGGAWRTGETFIAPLTASAAPSTVNKDREEYLTYESGDPYEGDIYNLNQTVIFTQTTAVTVSGGVSPYFYAWERISGAGEIDTPNSATTFFTKTAANPGSSGVFRCTVTDAQGGTATVNVTANY